MGKIHAGLISKFLGEESAVLVAADLEGVGELEVAVKNALQNGAQASVCGGRQIHRLMTDGEATIEFRKAEVLWHFSIPRLEELALKLAGLREGPGPCHHYIDILEPAPLMVISRGEYPSFLV